MKCWTNYARLSKIQLSVRFSDKSLGRRPVFSMNKPGYFFKSIIPFLIAVILTLVAAIPVTVIYVIRTLHSTSGNMDSFFQTLLTLTTDASFSQALNVIYGILGLLVFGCWYRKVFVLPFQNKPKKYPSGFSFHTIAALIILAFGLQYICSLVVDLTGAIHPAWISSYNQMMTEAGYENVSILLALYSVLIAPIVEELLFRGLVFRYSRYALPFWAANVWQAFLFGLIHMNVVQGVYAFTMGLFLGWVCRRGRGIKYSIVLHIIFNILGTFYSGFFSGTTALSYPIFISIGIVLAVFGLWLFYTDFLVEPERRRRPKENREDFS